MASAPALPSAARGNPQAFGKRGVLALVLFGTLAFIALLYLIGAGGMTGPANNGQSHAGSKGLTGYAALADLLEAKGHEVSISRSEAALDDEALLILTPTLFTDPEELGQLIARRRYVGPTLIILAKWQVLKPESDDDNAKSGWVRLAGASGTDWAPLVAEREIPVEIIHSEQPETRSWSTPEALRGTLPDMSRMQAFDGAGAEQLNPLVRSGNRVLAGYFDDDGYYPGLASAAGKPVNDADDTDDEIWNVTIVAEPDLMNNWGMADESRAELAHRIVDLAAESDDQPIIFDVTLNGLGGSRNLLTLAFTPPFLAATLSLILALLLVGWRAFRRFGPALAAAPTIAFGKGQLVENGAGVIQRTGRIHLLTGPYAALAKARIAHLLGVRGQDTALIDEALTRRGMEPLSPRLSALENARHRADIIRAARALHSLERTLTR